MIETSTTNGVTSAARPAGHHLVETMLVVSTAHLTPELAQQMMDGEGPSPSMQRGEGFLYHGEALHAAARATGFAPLRLLAERADALGCHWVMFDRDADVVEDIPWQDW